MYSVLFEFSDYFEANYGDSVVYKFTPSAGPYIGDGFWSQEVLLEEASVCVLVSLAVTCFSIWSPVSIRQRRNKHPLHRHYLYIFIVRSTELLYWYRVNKLE
jgi:hypothetical protein